MSLKTSELWTAAQSGIRSRISDKQYETWFRNLSCSGRENDSVVLKAPNQFSSAWIRDHYIEIIEDSLEEAAGRRVTVAIIAEDDNFVQTAPMPQYQPEPQKRAKTEKGVPLNKHFIFDSFVTGPCNALAHAAAVAVAESPGKSYNPLFIHSTTGMGKTHLLQACCHKMISELKGIKILYLSCETFVNEFIASIERGELETFRYNYRHVDVLVIDDIHFLANKERTQEEFFNTFNTLYHSQKQIILSSDSPPKEIPSLKERLVTRFKWGLVAKIEPPEMETRIAIVQMKARLLKREISGEVAEYIASRITSSVRELEGAVVRTAGIAALTDSPINLALARKVLSDTEGPAPRRGIADIQAAVASHFNVKVSDLLGKRRHKTIALPRQICMFLAKKLTSLSLVEIGGHFGGRDHTTVIYAVDKIEKMIDKDGGFAELVRRLRNNVLSG